MATRRQDGSWRGACAGSALALAAAGASCSNRDAPRDRPEPGASTAVAAPASPPASVAAAASASAAAPGAGGAAGADPEAEALRALARRWNAAHDAGDAEALRPVYAEKVTYYGRDLARDEVLRRKREAFGRGYSQTVGAIGVDRSTPERPRATFAKHWAGRGGGPGRDVVGVLEFVRAGGTWVVAKESDRTTEAPRRGALNACVDEVVGAVMSTREARAMLGGPTDPAHGHTSNGLRVAPREPGDATYSVIVHESHETHLATLGIFEVDPKTGVVRETLPDERKVETAPERVAGVKAACGGR
jgi:hypothetical protein